MRRHWTIVGLTVVTAFLSQGALCGTVSSTGTNGGGGGGDDSCTGDAMCNDGNDCTADACVNGVCVNIPIDDCGGGGNGEDDTSDGDISGSDTSTYTALASETNLESSTRVVFEANLAYPSAADETRFRLTYEGLLDSPGSGDYYSHAIGNGTAVLVVPASATGREVTVTVKDPATGAYVDVVPPSTMDSFFTDLFLDLVGEVKYYSYFFTYASFVRDFIQAVSPDADPPSSWVESDAYLCIGASWDMVDLRTETTNQLSPSELRVDFLVTGITDLSSVKAYVYFQSWPEHDDLYFKITEYSFGDENDEGDGSDDDEDVAEPEIAYYQFDGDADDATGNGNDGTEYGSFSYVSGVSGQAISLDGASGYLDLQENTNLDGFDAFTIAVWIRPTTDLDSDTGRQDILYNGPPLQHVTSYALVHDDTDGALAFHLHSESYWFNASFVIYEAEFPANEWFHVACTYDGTSVVRMYIDGEQAGTVSHEEDGMTGAVVDNSYPLTVGRRPDSQYYFNGALDELRIYSWSLSENEVQTLYQSMRP